MSWNHFPKLQPILLDSITQFFQFNSSAHHKQFNPSHLISPQNQIKKAKTSKHIHFSSSQQDKFEQLLKKIQKVTHGFEENRQPSAQLTQSLQKTALTFKHTMKTLQGQKDLNKSTRRVRTMKNIDDTIDDNKHYNKILAQTSPFKFVSTQNKSQKHTHLNLKYQNSRNIEITEPSLLVHNQNINNKQNQIYSLKSSQQTKLPSSPQKVKKINFDLKILQKAPIRQSIHLDNLENIQNFMNLDDVKNYFFSNYAKDQLKFSDFQLGNCIGSGKFGQVYVCLHKKTNFICAIKKIMKSAIEEYKMQDQFIRQLKISYMVDHPNVIKTYGHFHDQFHVFLIMQYAGNGCVIDNLQQNKSEQFSAKVLCQTLNAIDHLHRNKIVHRDIKPENIVVCFKDTYKLCDFGLSAFVNNDMKHTFCGTPDYLSPQMKDIGEYDFSVDLWSLGVLAYELVIGKAPFKEKISEWKKSGRKKSNYWTWKVQYPQEISSLGKEFMQGLLKEKPQQRASIWSCLRHEFINRHWYKEMDIIRKAQMRNWDLLQNY